MPKKPKEIENTVEDGNDTEEELSQEEVQESDRAIQSTAKEEEYDTDDEINPQLGLGERTYSQFIEDDEQPANRIRSSQRNLVNNKEFSVDETQDMLKVAIVSQEASKNFSRNFHKKNAQGTGAGILQNTAGIEQSSVETLHKNITYSETDQHTDFLGKVLENKRPAHVIAVIEGERDVLKKTVFIDDTQGKRHTYNLQAFSIEGENAKGGKDAKQNMHFYVREDMEKAIEIEAVDIEHGKDSFKVAKINFSTKKDEDEVQNYSVLAAHIPNKFIGSTHKDGNTHKAFEAYAEAQLEKNEIVIGYIGDTNFSAPMAVNSVPSVGGLADGRAISHTSSGAAKFTYFMQAVPLNADDKSFAMQQPSLLNISDVNIDNSKVATDHPSFMVGVLLNGKIENKARIENAKEVVVTSTQVSSEKPPAIKKESDSTATMLALLAGAKPTPQNKKRKAEVAEEARSVEQARPVEQEPEVATKKFKISKSDTSNTVETNKQVSSDNNFKPRFH